MIMKLHERLWLFEKKIINYFSYSMWSFMNIDITGSLGMALARFMQEVACKTNHP